MSKNKKINTPHVNKTEKKIGNTTYIITTRFNGDKSRNMGTSLARIIKRDSSNSKELPSIIA